MTLTKPQLRALEAVERGEVLRHERRGKVGYAGATRHMALRFENDRLIRWLVARSGFSGDRRARLTPAGEAALKEAREKEGRT